MKCLVDTDWIIDHLKGIEKVREKLKEFRIKNFFNQRIKVIKQDFWIRDELIIEDIPAGVCLQCGEKVVKAEVGRWVTELIKNSERIAKAPIVSVPTIKFDIFKRVYIMRQTLSKVRNLEKFIEKHGDDSFISQSISKILNYKIAKYEEKTQQLGEELKTFERAYGMKSSVFFKKFSEGKIGDDMDFIEWSSIYQMYQRLLEKKDEIKGEK